MHQSDDYNFFKGTNNSSHQHVSANHVVIFKMVRTGIQTHLLCQIHSTVKNHIIFG